MKTAIVPSAGLCRADAVPALTLHAAPYGGHERGFEYLFHNARSYARFFDRFFYLARRPDHAGPARADAAGRAPA